MDIHKATRKSVEWLIASIMLIPQDITTRHQQRTTGVLPFQRTTYFRFTVDTG